MAARCRPQRRTRRARAASLRARLLDGCGAPAGQPISLGGARLLRRAHYRRLDKPGSFHTRWGEGGDEVGVRAMPPIAFGRAMDGLKRHCAAGGRPSLARPRLFRPRSRRGRSRTEMARWNRGGKHYMRGGLPIARSVRRRGPATPARERQGLRLRVRHPHGRGAGLGTRSTPSTGRLRPPRC